MHIYSRMQRISLVDGFTEVLNQVHEDQEIIKHQQSRQLEYFDHRIWSADSDSKLTEGDIKMEENMQKQEWIGWRGKGDGFSCHTTFFLELPHPESE